MCDGTPTGFTEVSYPGMSVYGQGELAELATHLCAIEDWLRESCTARHADDMADVVHKAWQVVEDLHDETSATVQEKRYDAP